MKIGIIVDDVFVNIIECESVELAESITGTDCVAIPYNSPINIGDSVNSEIS